MLPARIVISTVLVRTLGVSLHFVDHAAVESLWTGDGDGIASTFYRPLATALIDNRMHVQVLGLYNSGTSLLKDLLAANFPEMEFNHVNYDMHSVCELWKHASLSTLQAASPQFKDMCTMRKTVAVAIVRNPVSWMTSMKRVAYDLCECIHGDDWFTRPCTYPSYACGGLAGKTFANMESIWTAWAQDYEHLESFGFVNSLVIKYEDLVINTSAVLDRIANVTGFYANTSNVTQIEDSRSPTENDPNGRDHAIEKINSASYRDEWTVSERQAICERLDAPTLQRYGYSAECTNYLTDSWRV